MLPREYGVSVTRPWNSISLMPNSRFPFDLWARREKDRGSCRVKSTLHSPFRSLYRGENAGHAVSHDASTLSIFTSAQGDSTRQFLWFNGRNERWIKFRFGTLVSKPPCLFLRPRWIVVAVKKKRNLSGNLIRLVSPWKRNKGIFRMYVVDKEDERGIWLSESKFSLITSNLR